MTDSVEIDSCAIYSVLADDPDLREIVTMFVDEMPLRIEKLLDEYRSKKWGDLKQTAHQLKGTVGSYGFGGISPLAGKLEAAIEEIPSEETIRQLLTELIGLCHRMSADPPGKAER